MVSKNTPTTNRIMVVNDVPGEECRIAILDNGRLDELYAERTATATNVGNIYKGRVINVEPAIQAAFIDFGEGQNGFLHISDLHPRYFPGEEKTESVGKKIPRRDRPMMQEALKRGDSVLVQVIKEGIGTKGPTLTSYISIPGRLMVMMPDMDRVGVSRKIEDEDKRREMREILDTLDLPEGLGFILRTAGFGRSKTELKRDLAYLTRLWKQMEKRIQSVQAPCPLYVESDLLIRTIRDILAPDISAIIVDSESGFERATDFLRVIAPRSAPRVLRYRRPVPIFHAFDIEKQIAMIHEREVPLPSGGAIVIDQTEALVAIDVNSGKSRSARDSETNAYRTNCEAVDEICRQLRLRDLGGLVINDLIDMVRVDHRRAIEKRFKDNLARDRAKTTITRISEFGILEMTRQRMRPSMRKTHYHTCAVCSGRGEVRTPESLAADAVRSIAYLLQFERVQTVEIVVSPRLASAFLSSRRRDLVDLEDEFGKTVKVRVSDAIPTDRIDYYAYDDRSADIDITRLPAPKAPDLSELEAADLPLPEPAPEEDAAATQPEAGAAGRKRRRRRGKPVAGIETGALKNLAAELDRMEQEIDEQLAEADSERETPAEPLSAPGSDDGGVTAGHGSPASGKKKRRRRRRRGRGGAAGENSAPPGQPGQPVDGEAAMDGEDSAQAAAPPAEEANVAAESVDGPGLAPVSVNGQATGDAAAGGKRRRRRRRRRRGSGAGDAAPALARSEGPVGRSPATSEDEASFEDSNAPPQARGSEQSDADESAESAASASSPAADESSIESGGRRRRRRRRGRGGKNAGAEMRPSGDGVASTPATPSMRGPAGETLAASTPVQPAMSVSAPAASASAARPRRTLYRFRKKAAPGVGRGGEEDGGSDE